MGSDHVSIRLESGIHIPKPHPFRFEQAWCSTENFFDLIKEWWESPQLVGCGAFNIAKKIKLLRERLKYWAKVDFGSIKLKKLALLHDIGLINATKESRPLMEEEMGKDNNLRAEMVSILKSEKIYWNQRARVTWLKEGDENTNYFHSIADSRRNSIFILGFGRIIMGLMILGGLVTPSPLFTKTSMAQPRNIDSKLISLTSLV